ncbi:MAG: hypothetical protein JW894_13175, partial [Bacteroidales bacterium]|nr:hypothetical protein [Bacteroidales bacterium]
MNLKRLNFKALFSALLISAVGTFTMGQITVLPVIDGDDSEAAWDAATEYAIEAVIADDFIDDAADLSGTFKLLWSADSVYVAVNVLDDSLYSLATNAYENDNVGIFFDLLNMKTGSYVDETQFYYEKNWWDGPDPIGARHGAAWATPPFGDFATTVDTSTSYLIELSFAWDQFGVTPVVGHQIGFDVKLSDNDGDGATPSEGRCQLAWSDTTDTGWNVPSVFGTLILKADGDVTLLPTIDGDASDDAWAMAPAYDITNVIADDFIDDAADLSGTFKVIWTSEDIYVLCEVQDDSLYSLATNAYENDNIGIFFDLLNKKTNSYVDTTQFYYEKNWWDGPDPIGARFGNAWATPPYNEFATTVDTGTSYLIEISLSWDRFGVDPMVGHQIGFDVKLSDNDGDGATPSEGRCQLAWSDTTDTGWNVPGVFGTLVLDKNGSVTVLPSVDGDGSDDVWDLVPAFEITNVIADDFIDDEADLSGITKLLWTSQSVFALVEVQDDSLYSLATNAYENDNVGIFFDLLNKKTNSYVDTTQFYYEKNWWDG